MSNVKQFFFLFKGNVVLLDGSQAERIKQRELEEPVLSSQVTDDVVFSVNNRRPKTTQKFSFL